MFRYSLADLNAFSWPSVNASLGVAEVRGAGAFAREVGAFEGAELSIARTPAG